MITLVHPELFNMEKSETENKFHQKQYKTSYTSKGNFLRPKEDKETPGKKYNKNLTFPVMDVLCEAEDPNAFPMILKTVKAKDGKINIEGIANADVKHDTHAICIAFPYKGLLKPFPEKMPFRVAKGFIAQSDYATIKFGKTKYRKVLYLILIPNTAILAPDHPYHKDELYFNIDTYSTVKKEDGSTPEKSLLHRLTISITNAGVTSRVIDRTVDYVDMHQYDGHVPFVEYQPPKKEKPAFEKKPYQKKESNYSPRTRHGESNAPYPNPAVHNKTASPASETKKIPEKKSTGIPSTKPGKVKTLADVEKVRKTYPLHGTEENETVVSSGAVATSLETLIKNANLTPSQSKFDKRLGVKKK